MNDTPECYGEPHVPREHALDQALLHALCDDAPIGVAVWHMRDTELLYANKALGDLLQVDHETLLGEGLLRAVHPVDQGTALELWAEAVHNAVEHDDSASVHELRFVRPDGTTVWARMHMSSFSTPTGRYGVLRFLDTTVTRKSEERLAYQSMHDPLTGLPNRTLLKDRLENALARRQRDDRPVAVVHVDLDDFKTINDSLGHISGDGVIREIAQRLRTAVRPGDTIARVGGDEFVIVAEINELEHVNAMLRRLVATVQQPMLVAGQTLHPTMSIGLTVYEERVTPSRDAVEALLRDAATALHAAKRLGRGRVAPYTAQLRARLQERVKMEGALRSALLHDELVAYFQPIVDSITGEITGAEALIRWETEEDGLRLPAQFLPTAAEVGVMREIADLSLQQAVAMLSRVRQRHPDFTINANVCIEQLMESDLVGNVATLLDTYGVPPEALILEITETVYSEAMEADSEVLGELDELGVQLALDDFGTGYSSLLRAMNYPLDVLKIDRAFTQGICEPAGGDLVRVLVDLARVLSLKTTLEGVEDAEQYDAAGRLGVDHVQGFYVARALPAGDLELLLENGWR